MHEHAHGHEHDHGSSPSHGADHGPGPGDQHPSVPAADAQPERAAPRRLLNVGHAFLHVATLAHAAEHARLVPILEQAVEHALATRQPFPHTMLSGGSDTSKRVLAHAIAADLAAPLAELDLSAMRSPDQLHERLQALEPGAIVLASAGEQALHGPLPDLVSAANCGRCVLRNIPGARYERFTIILCTRDRVDTLLGGRDVFEQRFYFQRTAESEAIRLRRVLRRAGATCSDDAVAALAEGVLTMRLPTIGTAAAVTALLRRRGVAAFDLAQLNEECWKTLMVMADPRWLRTLAKRDRRKAQAAAEVATQAAAPAAAPQSPPPPPRASDGGGLANAA